MSMPTNQQRLDACYPPSQGHVMYQSWKELLFLHWEVNPALTQASLPPGLTIDTYKGNAYLGIVPFFMCGTRPRFLPTAPGLSNFLELNVRTYVYDKHGRPGVWFYSLDANQKLAVRIARTFFHLPYFDAEMSASTANQTVTYHSQQAGSAKKTCFQYTPTESISLPSIAEYVDSLDFFFAERYFLFTQDEKTQQLYSGRVHHSTYPLHKVKVDQFSSYPIKLAGFEQPTTAPDHAVMSHGVDVKIYPLQKII